MTGAPIYRLEGVRHRRALADGGVFELVVERLVARPGAGLALTGPSGCGKSTLIDLLAAALKPTAARRMEARMGARAVDLADLWARGDDRGLARFRACGLGYVLQTGGLLPFLSVRANIALARRLAGLAEDGAVERLARRFGFAARLDARPEALSVGERQRVAIARALAHEPAILLADEPTAALDPPNAAAVFDALEEVAAEPGRAVIVACHDWARLARARMTELRFELASVGAVTTARIVGP